MSGKPMWVKYSLGYLHSMIFMANLYLFSISSPFKYYMTWWTLLDFQWLLLSFNVSGSLPPLHDFEKVRLIGLWKLFQLCYIYKAGLDYTSLLNDFFHILVLKSFCLRENFIFEYVILSLFCKTCLQKVYLISK